MWQNRNRLFRELQKGYWQKQKDGLVIRPPFGYWKDKNTNRIFIHPEAAETVRRIYALYLQGCGQKEIARRLNALDCKTPAQLWTEQMVANGAINMDKYNARRGK